MKDFNSYIDALSKLISFRSVLSTSENGMPFGREAFNALDFYLKTAREMGFETKNYEGYVGEVTLGEGEEFGIMGHLDVVPEGDGWNTNPYELTFKDDVYYGRGLLDDKGPILLMLFILKELKESGVKINKKFRLFVGCNEETGWKDVEYFSKNYGFPKYGFSPDGNFPVSYAEKGMAIVEFKLPKLKNYDNLTGGTVVNAVCGRATMRDKNTGKILEFNGKACHGSRPENGINAIKKMFVFLLDNGENVKNIFDCFFNDREKIFEMKNEQGDVTFSPDIICEKDDGIYLKCDCRFPYPFNENDVKNKFDKFGFPYEFFVKHPTQYVDKDSDLVKILINSYNKVMNLNEKPISQCGTTFARVFQRGVAFGPEFPFIEPTIHQPNECVSKEHILKMYEIYKKAIFDLAK